MHLLDDDWLPRRCTSDQCNQGRTKCPTPQACEIHESDGGEIALGGLLTAAVIVLILWVASLLLPA